jgi:hypothetical protein
VGTNPADRLLAWKEITGAGTGTNTVVTMDNNSTTNYGQLDINFGASVVWSTLANTQLRMVGGLNIWSGGMMSMGTSATPVPRGTTAALEFLCTTPGQYGLWVRDGGAGYFYGQSPTAGNNTVWTFLNADVAAGGASPQTITVAGNTGWKQGGSFVTFDLRTATVGRAAPERRCHGDHAAVDHGPDQRPSGSGSCRRVQPTRVTWRWGKIAHPNRGCMYSSAHLYGGLGGVPAATTVAAARHRELHPHGGVGPATTHCAFRHCVFWHVDGGVRISR